MSTCCLLTYLKIRKIEGPKISPPTHPPIRTIKVLGGFFSADYQGKIETSIFVRQSHIKMERPSSGPLGVCFRRLPSGDNYFRIHLKVYLLSNQKRRCPVPFEERIIKWKDRQMDPFGAALQTPFGG